MGGHEVHGDKSAQIVVLKRIGVGSVVHDRVSQGFADVDLDMDSQPR